MSELTTEIPGYRVLDKIHGGGQGVVYRAVQVATHRIVALKILNVRHASSDAQRQRFQREIELTARLRHPHIVTVYDSGVHDGILFYAMEYIEGRTLDAYLDETPLDLKQRVFLFAKIAAAVGYAHEHFVFHRDLKPGNILVDAHGEPHVLDFGLAKIRADETDSSATRVTRPGEFLGTLAYAAPEQTQVDSDLTSRRTDVYALGVVFYEGLSGKRPYPYGGGVHQSIRHIVETPPRPLSSFGDRFDDDLSRVLMKALAKDPMRRYVTAVELAADLHRYLDGQPVRAKRDSTAYVVWKSVHRVVASSPKLFIFMIALASAITLNHLATESKREFEAYVRFAAAAQPVYKKLHGKGWSDRVLVVGMTDETTERIEAIAASEGLKGVTAANFLSWRAVHGSFMRRLAKARPSVLTWDVAFVSRQPHYDASFVEGLRALRGAGTQTVVAVDRTYADGTPKMCREILEESDAWGWLYLTQFWRGPSPSEGQAFVIGTGLLAIDPHFALTPTLSLATYTSDRQPHATPRYAWDLPMRHAKIHYEIDTLEKPVEVEHVLISTHVREAPFERAEPGMPKYGMIASWTVLPPDEVLERHTIPYHEVFSMEEGALREIFEGRIVVVGDLREKLPANVSADRTRVVDGGGGIRKAFSVYQHAAGVSDLVVGSRFRRTTKFATVLLLTLIGVCGGANARYRGKGPLRDALVLLGAGSLAWIAVVFVAAAVVGVAFSPTTAVLAWITGLGSGTLIAAIERRSKPWLRPAQRLTGIPTPTPTPRPVVSRA